jgi:hypothetical protein
MRWWVYDWGSSIPHHRSETFGVPTRLLKIIRQPGRAFKPDSY